MPSVIAPDPGVVKPPDLAAVRSGGGRARPASDRFMDNFVVLRAFAALLIIYGNDWMLSSLPGPGLWGVPFAEIGYDLLFSVSGYLLTLSWDRNPDPARFFAGRILRVLPGLLASVLATAFLLGPICTTLSIRYYFLNGRTFRYLENAVLHRQLWLPGVFVGQPSGGEVNPVLWSLVPGAFCCAVLPVIAGLPHRRRLAALALATAGCGAAALYLRHGVNGVPASLFRVSLPDFLGVVPFFAAGAFLRTLERDMPGLYRADFAMLAFALNWIVASWLEWWDVPIAWLTLPYMAICFGRLSNPVSRWIAARTDLSYGLFLVRVPAAASDAGFVARQPVCDPRGFGPDGGCSISFVALC